jgi:2-methylcitrate dehydratase PrpD
VRRILVHPRPRTGLEGKFSLEYCLAAAVLDGEVSLRQFEDGMVQRPEIERLIPRIHVEAHPAVKADTKDLLSELTVTLADGRRISRQATTPRGDATRPLTAQEIQEKYERCAGLVLGPEPVRRSLHLIESLEHVRDVRQLVCSLYS